MALSLCWLNFLSKQALVMSEDTQDYMDVLACVFAKNYPRLEVKVCELRRLIKNRGKTMFNRLSIETQDLSKLNGAQLAREASTSCSDLLRTLQTAVSAAAEGVEHTHAHMEQSALMT